jgi:arylsulfatase A-like enzyme
MKPNILFIMTDHGRADHLDAGHPCAMPNVRRLAGEGVRFTHAFTPTTHCCPARASLMTGQYPSKHGVFNNVQNDSALQRDLNPGCETWSEKLRDAGYNLAYAGKWHVSAKRNPSDFGWDELDICSTGIYPHHDYESYVNLPRNDPRPRARGELHVPGWRRLHLYGTSSETFEQTRDYAFMNSARERLRTMARAKAPWCLYLGLTGPHGPFVVPAAYARRYDPADVVLPPNYNDDMRNRPGYYGRLQRKYAQLSADEAREAVAHYWGYCDMMDDLTGIMLDELQATGQADDTLVIYASDHGEFSAEHGLFAKGIAPFDGAYRVPYVFRWPNGIAAPGRCEQAFITHCDLSPTLTELTGASPTAGPSGRSLVPFLRGERPSDWPEEVYTQCNGVEILYTQRAIRTRKWKLVYNPVDRDELYDLEKDPHEMVNLVEKPELQPVVKELFIKLWTHGRAECDAMSSYETVSLAPFGPALALGIDS